MNASCIFNSNYYYVQQKYLKSFPFQNAKTSDFWRALAEVAILL